MLLNATLTNVTPPPVSSPTGKLVYGAGTTLSPGLRCTLVPLTTRQEISPDQRISQSEGVLYVLMSELAAGAGAALVERARVTVTLDEVGAGAAVVYEVMKAAAGVKAGGLSHFECFLKRI